jgi:formate hydrogenlyase transcriptional activator
MKKNDDNTEKSQILSKISIEQVTDGVVWIDAEGRVHHANSAACDLLGFSKEELANMTVSDLDPNFPSSKVKKLFKETRQLKKYTHETFNRRNDGTIIPVEVTMNHIAIDGVEYSCCFIRDISDRKKAEECLRESEARFRSTFEQAAVGICHLTPEGKLLLVNQTLCDLLGYKKDALLKLSYQAITHPDDIVVFERMRAKLLSGEKATASFEKRYVRKDGSTLWGNFTISLKKERNGRPSYFIGFYQDITERKKVATALKESESKLRAILNNQFQFNGLLTPDGRVLMLSESGLTFLGIDESKVIGKYFWETPWFEHSKELQQQQQEGISKAAAGEFVRFEITMPDRKGNLHYFDHSFKPLRDEKGDIKYITPEARDITNLKKVETDLKQALNEVETLKNRLQEENVYLKEEIRLEHNFGEIVGRSETFKEVLSQVEQVAASDTTTLILGETGTGKELIVRAVHNLSIRKDRSLVKVNCAALPENLIENELFGHEKGAFTGALARKIGRFELANNGTIFLDEIGDLPLDLQARLLRVLQEGEFERLGGTETIRVDVRIIAATNRNLEQLIRNGDFRQDLYYRLNVFPIHCPPLRHRREDIPLLVKFFIGKYSAKIGKTIEKVSQKTMHALQNYHWPGNIRELENIIERGVVTSKGNRLEIGKWFQPETPEMNPTGVPTLEENERQLILKALKETGWRISGEKGAAKILDINPHTLISRMKKLGIKR